MKYLGLLLSIFVLSSCAMSPYRTPIESDPKVEIKDDSTKKTEAEKAIPEPEKTAPVTVPPAVAAAPVVAITPVVESEEIKPIDKTDAASDVQDVGDTKFSYIDQKYGDKKDDAKIETTKESDASGDDLKINPVMREVPKNLKKLDGVAPEKALMYLKHGNTRFVKGSVRKDGQSKKDIQRLTKNEKPHAIVFTTSDSRVAPELIFDEKLGEIYVIRNLGLNVDSAAIDSMEYATQYLGTKLIIVMDRNYPENKHSDMTHAKDVAQKILSQSKVLKNYSDSHQLKMVPAVYHLESGKVDFAE